MEKLLTEIIPDHPFSYKSSLFAHGWIELAPFRIESDAVTFSYSFKITAQKTIQIKISSVDDKSIHITSSNDLNPNDIEKVVKLVGHMFRLDENFSEFYYMAKNEPAFSWIVENKAGRLLRAGSLWEDMVKILCTTNCSWHLTKLMIKNLVQKIGQDTHFPEPGEIAAWDERSLRTEIKMGYRAPYLFDIARNVHKGLIDLKKYSNWTGTSEELFQKMRKIKGLGEYAVSSLLKLIGRYDYLGIDSWGRRTFSNRYNQGKQVEDEMIKLKYKKYGKWAGLFFWMDMTRDLYNSYK